MRVKLTKTLIYNLEDFEGEDRLVSTREETVAEMRAVTTDARYRDQDPVAVVVREWEMEDTILDRDVIETKYELAIDGVDVRPELLDARQH